MAFIKFFFFAVCEVHQFILKQNDSLEFFRNIEIFLWILIYSSVGVGITLRTYAENQMEVIDHNDLRIKKQRKNARTKNRYSPARKDFYCFHESICTAYMRLIYCTLVIQWKQRPPKTSKSRSPRYNSQRWCHRALHSWQQYISASRAKVKKFRSFPGLFDFARDVGHISWFGNCCYVYGAS